MAERRFDASAQKTRWRGVGPTGTSLARRFSLTVETCRRAVTSGDGRGSGSLPDPRPPT